MTRRFLPLVVAAAAAACSCAIAPAGAQATTQDGSDVYLTVEPYVYINIIADEINLTPVTGLDWNKTKKKSGSSWVDWKSNLDAAEVRCPLSLTLKRRESVGGAWVYTGEELGAVATISLQGTNWPAEEGETDGFQYLLCPPGNHPSGIHLDVSVTTLWGSQIREGTYHNTVTLDIGAKGQWHTWSPGLPPPW